MQPVSQYMVNKQRKELRRLEAELVAARRKALSYQRGGYGRHEAVWRCVSLRESILVLREWLASARVEKAPDWSPARRARHGFAPLAN